MKAALVGASPLLAALREKLAGECTLAVERTTADHIAQVADTAVLDLPAGEARDFARELGAWNIRVLDLGPDLRVPQVPCALLDAEEKRIVAMPSAPAIAAFLACAPLLMKDVMHAGRLAVLGGAGDFEWVMEQAGFPPLRPIVVPLPLEGITAVVVGEIGNGGHAPDAVQKAYAGVEEARLCGPGIQPAPSRVKGSAVAEVSVRVDEFTELVVAACALDPVSFLADAALQALRQMAA